MSEESTPTHSGTGPSEHLREAATDPLYAEGETDAPSLVSLLNVFLRHRWKVVGTPIVAALLVGAFSFFFSATTYTSEASFVSERGRDGRVGSLSGLASQFGFEIPTEVQGQSPQFYRDLLRSRRILQKAVTTQFLIIPPRSLSAESVASYDLFPGDSGRSPSSDAVAGGSIEADAEERRATLVEYYDLDQPEAAAREATAIRRLRQSLSVNTDPQTGLIDLSVTTRNPILSQQVADRLVELVNQYNLEVRQSRGAAEASFVQERLAHARAELRAAEDSLENFLEHNRRIENSPRLQFEHDRLQRQVQLKQSVVNSLSQSYEQARISEVRNTPVVTVVEPPDLPLRSDPNRPLFKMAVGFLFGGLVGGFWAFGADIMVSDRDENPDEYREFDRLREDLREEFRNSMQKLANTLRSLASK